MKILSSQQVRELDAYTIENEPILDINLMERAAHKCTKQILKNTKKNKKISVFCGSGNNGGDGLAIARMLVNKNLLVKVYLISENLNVNCKINLQRLLEIKTIDIHQIKSEDSIPKLSKNEIVIDALFGSGLNKKVEGLAQKVIENINQSGTYVISIDIPSGFFTEDNGKLEFDEKLKLYPQAIKAHCTLTLELPFLSFFFPDLENNVGKIKIVPIGLHQKYLSEIETENYYTQKKDIIKFYKHRKKFTHKGTYGHALLLSGCYGKMGAAVLASRACLRAGVGLLTTHVPRYGAEIIQNSVPEAMLSIDTSDILISEFPNLTKFSAIAIGPALGTKANSQKAVAELLEKCTIPLVIDADGINILSEHKDWYEKLPENTILTPHPLEFERLVGKSFNYFERLQKQKEFARNFKVIVILKGANTCITLPNGKSYFNSTGNSGMATAGSGDVLTGIILSLLAQKYSPEEASILGVYIHGKSADIALKTQSMESLIANDLIENLGKAFKSLT